MQNRNSSSSPLKNQRSHTLLNTIQVLALLTMEMSKSFSSDDSCDQKVDPTTLALRKMAGYIFARSVFLNGWHLSSTKIPSLAILLECTPETNALTPRTLLKRKIAGISKDLVPLIRPLPGPIQGGWRPSWEMKTSSVSVSRLASIYSTSQDAPIGH